MTKQPEYPFKDKKWPPHPHEIRSNVEILSYTALAHHYQNPATKPLPYPGHSKTKTNKLLFSITIYPPSQIPK